jgi:radical SAM-linked protein
MADVVFAGGSAPAHPSLVTLLETHHQRFSTHGVTGRTTAVDPAHFSMSLARELRKGKSSRLVFLPVAASERLRALCGRPLARAAFLNVVETVLRGGWGQVRLAFVLGIPEETEADRDELRGLVEEIRGMRPPGGNPSRIHIELIPFSPLPATPRAAELPADRTLVASVDAAWRRRFAKGNRFAVSTGSPIRAAVTALLWRGSPEWADAVLAVARDTRLGSDSEPEAWDEALSRLGFESASPATWPPGLPQAGEGTTVPEDPLPAWQCKSFGVPPWASPGRRPRREGRTGPGRRADRYRIRFSKSEAARFTSHLDVGRALERGFRRAQLPVAWSQGKEPRPKVAFGPPLPLGMTGDAEYLDVVFSRDVPDTFLGAMSGMLPEGLALTAAAPVRNEAASLASAIQFADYEVWFPDSLLEQDFDGVSFDGLKDRLETRVTEVMASDTFEITRVRKERMQKINARPSLKKMEVVRDDGGRPVLSLRLTLNQPESIRPEPLTAALCHWVAFDERLLRIHRTGLYIPGREGPLDPLEVVRADFAWWRQPIRGGTVL